MALPNSETRATLYITDPPDWSLGVVLTPNFMTEVYRAYDGTEQRLSRRVVPRYEQNYTLAALSTPQFSVRRARAMLETQTVVVVPIWSLRFVAASHSGGVITFSEDVSQEFRAGYPVYIEDDGAVIGFWNATVVNGTQVTVDVSTNPIPTISSVADFYPCIYGKRKDQTGTFNFLDVAGANETIDVIDL